ESKIRRNIKLAESPSFGQTILKYEPQSHGAADYRALAREVFAHVPGAVKAVVRMPENEAKAQAVGTVQVAPTVAMAPVTAPVSQVVVRAAAGAGGAKPVAPVV